MASNSEKSKKKPVGKTLGESKKKSPEMGLKQTIYIEVKEKDIDKAIRIASEFPGVRKASRRTPKKQELKLEVVAVDVDELTTFFKVRFQYANLVKVTDARDPKPKLQFYSTFTGHLIKSDSDSDSDSDSAVTLDCYDAVTEGGENADAAGGENAAAAGYDNVGDDNAAGGDYKSK